jgi:hypothetical protein
METITTWLNVVTSAVALLAVLIGGLWAYTKFILERGLLPPVEFTLDCNRLGAQGGKQLVEIQLHLKNLGGSTLVAEDIQTRIRYITSDDEVTIFSDAAKPTFGRVRFPHSHGKAIVDDQPNGSSLIPILNYDTFVQPGVDQAYTLVTALPQSATYLLVWAQFRYAKHPSSFERVVIRVSRVLGLIHYSLDHVAEPHTIERAFKLGRGESGLGESGNQGIGTQARVPDSQTPCFPTIRPTNYPTIHTRL